MLAIRRGAGWSGFAAAFQIPLRRNWTNGFAIGFGRDAHQSRQARGLIRAFAGEIEKLFADAAVAAEHVGEQGEDEEEESQRQENSPDDDERGEGAGFAVPEIPAGHEAFAEHSDQAQK